MTPTGYCDRVISHPPRGAWKWSNSEGLEWRPNPGRHISAQEARECLAARGPLVFLGESTTRYQYLALAHFLHHGTWDTWPRGKWSGSRFSVCSEESIPKQKTAADKWSKAAEHSIA
jgi:hypothetical protein